jgi:hypothetical protein
VMVGCEVAGVGAVRMSEMSEMTEGFVWCF